MLEEVEKQYQLESRLKARMYQSSKHPDVDTEGMRWELRIGFHSARSKMALWDSHIFSI